MMRTPQTKHTIGYLGPEYTFTHVAALRFLEKINPQAELVPMHSNTEVIQAVHKGELTGGVVPYQNIGGGRVPDVLDSLWRTIDLRTDEELEVDFYEETADVHPNVEMKLKRPPRVHINYALVIPIEMCIGSRCNPENVNAVLSKDVAISQCSVYLGNKYPQAERINVDSTGQAVGLVANDPKYANAAALGPLEAFLAYEVPVRERGVANISDNMTRFCYISREPRIRKSRKSKIDMTTVVVQPRRSYRHLGKELETIAAELGIEIRYRYGRETGFDSERVYLDLIGHVTDKPIRSFLNGLKKGGFGRRTQHAILGSYPFEEFYGNLIQTIGFLGGKHGKGRTLADYLLAKGYNVLVKSESEKTQRFKSADFVVRSSDVVIVNHPHHVIEETLNSMREEVRDDILIVINSTVLEEILAKAEKIYGEERVLGIDALTTHHIPTLEGQKVAVVSDGSYDPRSKKAQFIGVLEEAGARVVFCDADEHDRYSLVARNIPLIVSMALLNYFNMPGSGISLERLRELSFPDAEIFFTGLEKAVMGYTPFLGSNLKAFHRTRTVEHFADLLRSSLLDLHDKMSFQADTEEHIRDTANLIPPEERIAAAELFRLLYSMFGERKQ
ncbi:MAG: prephenate dehydratase domain-containing protein [Candidatus Woesearchaeota archaeon]